MSETAEFPTTITTQLYEVVARKSTQLTANIDNAVTTIPVDSTSGFPSQCFITIDSETMLVTSTDSTNFYVSRAYAGTAASHLENADVKLSVAAAIINRQTAEIVAIQNYIGTSGNTRTTTIDYRLRYLSSFTQGNSTEVPNLNAQFLGGSTRGEFYAAVSTAFAATTAQNALKLTGIEGATVIQNDIEFTPDSFNLNNDNPASLIDIAGLTNTPRIPKVEFGNTDEADLPTFKMPPSYNGGTITWTLLYCASTASVTFDIGIQAAQAGADAAYNPSYGSIIYFGTITNSATTGNIGFTSKDIAGASLGLTNNKLNYLRIEGGTVCAVQILNMGLRWNKG